MAMDLSLRMGIGAGGASGGGTPAPTAEIVLVGIEADSTEVGIYVRDGGDIAWPNTSNWRTRAPAGISTSLPYDEAVPPDGNDYLALSEYFAKQRNALSGLPVFVMPHGWNSTKIVGVGAGWGVGNGVHEAFISRSNTAIAAYLAANPGGVFSFSILVTGGVNDILTGATGDQWETAIVAAVADARSRIFKNGVSGEAIGEAATVVFRGMTPEFIAALNATANDLEYKMRKFMYSIPNARYWKSPEGEGDTSGHDTNVGQRNDGIGCANAIDVVTVPTTTLPSTWSVYADQKMRLEIPMSEVAHPYLDGTDAASFEIVTEIEGNGDSNVNNSRTTWFVQPVGGGTLTAGVYDFNVNLKGNGPTAGVHPMTVTSVANYGSQAETIVATALSSASYTGSNGNAKGQYVVPVSLKRGLNYISILFLGGSATSITTATTTTGLEGVKDANSVAGHNCFIFYAAQDQSGSLLIVANGTINEIAVSGTAVVGTAATASSGAILGFGNQVNQVGPITCPAGGIVIGSGMSNLFNNSTTTLAAGITGSEQAFTAGPSPNACDLWSGYRTTTGVMGITESNIGCASAIALAAA